MSYLRFGHRDVLCIARVKTRETSRAWSQACRLGKEVRARDRRRAPAPVFDPHFSLVRERPLHSDSAANLLSPLVRETWCGVLRLRP